MLQLASLMEEHSSDLPFSQREYRKQWASQLAQNIALDGKWSFLTDGTGSPDHTDNEHTGLVYFATTPVYPTLIKIGSTRDPIERMKQKGRREDSDDFCFSFASAGL